MLLLSHRFRFQEIFFRRLNLAQRQVHPAAQPQLFGQIAKEASLAVLLGAHRRA